MLNVRCRGFKWKVQDSNFAYRHFDTTFLLLLLLSFKGPPSTCRLFWRLWLGVFAVVPVRKKKVKNRGGGVGGVTVGNCSV